LQLYEKRKIGALEIETLVSAFPFVCLKGIDRLLSQQVKELRVQGNHARLKSIIQYIIDNYVYSANGNSKKGGLIALAAVVIGLGRETYRYINMVIPPVLHCFTDLDHRVRYYSAEALYNLAKVAGPLVLQYFCEIFDGLCKLAADPEKVFFFFFFFFFFCKKTN
jgi:vacuole morphology and inheritance protein 14